MVRRTSRGQSLDHENPRSIPEAAGLPLTDSAIANKPGTFSDGQETLLEALRLVPVTVKPTKSQSAGTRYRTRSGKRARVASAAKNHDEKDLPRPPRSASPRDSALLSKTTRGGGWCRLAARNDATERTRSCGKSVPRKTQTVEPVGLRLVRCVACKVVFGNVRQIISHSCAQ